MSKITTSKIFDAQMITDWEGYVMNVSAVTTPPTKGTIVRDQAWGRRVCQDIEIMWDYIQSAIGTAGSGYYLFPAPPGIVFDTAITGISAAPFYNASSHVGSGMCFNGSNSYPMTVHVYSVTHLTLMYDSPGSVVSDAAMGFASAADLAVSFKASIPVVGWGL